MCCAVTLLCSWSCCNWTPVCSKKRRNTFIHLNLAKNASESHVSSSPLMNLYFEVIVFKRGSERSCFFFNSLLTKLNQRCINQLTQSCSVKMAKFGYLTSQCNSVCRIEWNTSKINTISERCCRFVCRNWMWHPMIVEHLVHPIYDHSDASSANLPFHRNV